MTQPYQEIKLNGWNEWSKHVLIEIERLNNGLKATDLSITDLRITLEKRLADLKSEVLEKINEEKDLATTDALEQKLAIRELMVKAGVWGLLGGIIPGAITLLILFLEHIL
jgi:hypothetical protein